MRLAYAALLLFPNFFPLFFPQAVQALQHATLPLNFFSFSDVVQDYSANCDEQDQQEKQDRKLSPQLAHGCPKETNATPRHLENFFRRIPNSLLQVSTPWEQVWAFRNRRWWRRRKVLDLSGVQIESARKIVVAATMISKWNRQRSSFFTRRRKEMYGANIFAQSQFSFD